MSDLAVFTYCYMVQFNPTYLLTYVSDFLVNYPIYARNFFAPRDVYLMLGAAFTPKTFDIDPTLLDSKAIKALRLSGLYARQS
ncbi:hypothetical protein [Microcoleus sp.]|uniref:hypothetical protein n=1 Tax=Microcoleus sp. TaxID=44472 RepID=UPI0035241706